MGIRNKETRGRARKRGFKGEAGIGVQGRAERGSAGAGRGSAGAGRVTGAVERQGPQRRGPEGSRGAGKGQGIMGGGLRDGPGPGAGEGVATTSTSTTTSAGDSSPCPPSRTDGGSAASRPRTSLLACRSGRRARPGDWPLGLLRHLSPPLPRRPLPRTGG